MRKMSAPTCMVNVFFQGDHFSWKVMEFSKTIFPVLESHGKQPRSWKGIENDDDVLEFFCKSALEFLFL